MLSKKYRLKKNSDFRYLYQRGKSVKTSAIVLYRGPRKRKTKENTCRVGFSVSKKIGNAVVRNRVKRKLRQAAAAFLPPLATGAVNEEVRFLTSYDYIIVARFGAVAAKTEVLERQLAELLRRL